MKSHPRLNSWTLVATVSAVGLFGLAAFRAQADQWDKKTVLTVDQPIQVRNTYLEPGKYVLKLYDSNSNRHVVQIFNGDQSRIIDTVMAIPNYRMNPTGESQFTFWETPPGTAKALRTWFYPGDTIGQEFPYPKEPRQLAMLTTQESLPTPVVSQPAEPQPSASAPVEPTPQPQAVQEPPAEEQPREIALNSAPPAPAPAAEPAAEAPAPQATPAPQTPQTRDELPKTASPYPLAGGLGLGLLALYGWLRVKQTS